MIAGKFQIRERMAKSRIEMQTDEEAELLAERIRFEELADQYRQQGHLPPQGDQSWREQEAMRRAAYDKGYSPPQNDQSWRDREAMLFASPGEDHGAAARPDDRLEMEEAVLRPVPAAKGGQGGTILIFILVAAIAFGIAALTYPEMLTAAYWQSAQNNSAVQPATPRAGQAPTPSPAAPVAAPVEQPPPPSAPALDLRRIPAEPPAQEARSPSPVPVIDARAPAKPASEPKPVSRSRPPAGEDRDAAGFYAKAPGPDGVMRDTYFPTDPKMDARAPADAVPAKPDADGFYAKVPGPDGNLEMKFFPSKPPPR